ncbi:MAG: glycine cleavage system aminomethyltransferase GcvT [Candidatus Krumholzibacteria bacterium]|nr:glycine cleavage system aminomethyltransferase GcvT [Candidatus Krumholzibacteria bacterium]
MAAKKTPIYDSHVEQGGRIVEFAGYLMPVSFEGIVAEHQRVRTKVGLFDVSHMGEIDIKGDGAAVFTDSLVTNRVQTLEEGQICYAVACNERGRALDDLLVYKFSDSRILLVVNAVNADKIFEHVASLAPSSIEVTDSTQGIGQIAVQGPASKKLLLGSGFCSAVHELVERMSYYHFVTFEKSGSEIIVSRTGYTGELGFEIYLPDSMALELWNELLEAGKEYGAAPIGLGARDTLRFEPSFCLYGNELNEEISPLEAGLSWLVKLKKDRFIGRDSFLMEKERGPERKLVGLELEGRNIARHGYRVMLDGAEIGAVTSGTFAPTLKKSLAMALVSRSVPKDAGGLSIDVRGRSVPASLAGLPFYRSRAGD